MAWPSPTKRPDDGPRRPGGGPGRQGAGSGRQGGGPSHRHRRRDRTDARSNSRLTATTGAVLLVLLAAEGFTVLSVRQMLPEHVFIGMLLVPPVLLKMGSTGYRFFRYYSGSPGYRVKGPPPPLLRLLGPFVVVLTVLLIASGIALLLVGAGLQREVLFVHKASFVLWFGAMTIHVLGHLAETGRLAPLDWLRRTRGEVAGARIRQWAVVISLAAGIPLGLLLLNRVGPWLRFPFH